MSLMELERLNCNSCGAPLEVSTTANFVTCVHCSAQLHVRRTESAAFTEQLEHLESNQGQMMEKLERLERDSELAKLDRDWERNLEKFMVTNKHGVKNLPTEGGSMVAMVFVIVFGIFWMVMAASIAPPMALFGLLFIAVGVFGSLHANAKAKEYRRAYGRYKKERRDILRRQ